MVKGTFTLGEVLRVLRLDRIRSANIRRQIEVQKWISERFG